MAGASPISVVDDRGKQLPAVPREMLDKLIWHDRQRPRQYARRNYTRLVVAAGIGILVVYRIVTQPATFAAAISSPFAVSLFAVIAFLTLLVSLATRRDRREVLATPGELRAPHEPHIALLSAHRHCGACGYSLREIPPDPDQCATCSECGAAWHAQRWTLVDYPVLNSSLLYDALSGRLFPGPLNTDDRGVPLSQPTFRLARWLSDPRTPRPLAGELRAADAAARKRRVMCGTMVIALLWFVAAALFLLLHDTAPRDRLGDMLLFAIVSALIVALLLYLVVRFELTAARCRTIILGARVCPNCRTSLPSLEAAPPTFDGCTPCPTCGRAWRLLRDGAPS